MATQDPQAVDLDLGPGDVSTPSSPGGSAPPKRKKKGEPIAVVDRKTGAVTGHVNPKKDWLFTPAKVSE